MLNKKTLKQLSVRFDVDERIIKLVAGGAVVKTKARRRAREALLAIGFFQSADGAQ